MSNLKDLKAVESLLVKLDRWDHMTSGQKAAARAQLTKLLKQFGDNPEFSEALQIAKDFVGEPEGSTYAKQTADDVVTEYHGKYAGYNVRQRAAFKAKLTRMIAAATEAADGESVGKLQNLTELMDATAVNHSKKQIGALAQRLAKKAGAADS